MRVETVYVTEEEFWARYGPEDRVELVDGEVLPKYGHDGPMSPTGTGHGRIVMNLLLPLGAHVQARGLGEVYTDPAAFVISETPRRLRCPDVAFVAAGRAPEAVETSEALRLAPDLVAGVISPSEPAYQADAKIEQYLDAGVRLVWKIDAKRQVVTVYALDGATVRLRGDDGLDGVDVVPGFTLPPGALFRGVAR